MKNASETGKQRQAAKKYEHTAALLFLPEHDVSRRRFKKAFLAQFDTRLSLVLVDEGSRTLKQVLKAAWNRLELYSSERAKLSGSTLMVGVFMEDRLVSYSLNLPMPELALWAAIGVEFELTVYRASD